MTQSFSFSSGKCRRRRRSSSSGTGRNRKLLPACKRGLRQRKEVALIDGRTGSRFDARASAPPLPPTKSTPETTLIDSGSVASGYQPPGEVITAPSVFEESFPSPTHSERSAPLYPSPVQLHHTQSFPQNEALAGWIRRCKFCITLLLLIPFFFFNLARARRCELFMRAENGVHKKKK